MKHFDFEDMIKGWFIGNFQPTLYATNDVEIGVKKYLKGYSEKKHFHKISTEFTVIISGKVKLNGMIYGENEIIKINNGIVSDFFVLEDIKDLLLSARDADKELYFDKSKEFCRENNITSGILLLRRDMQNLYIKTYCTE